MNNRNMNMLFKLSLSGMRSKLKDYIVLLLGLVLSISIFYMFQTLALNKGFITQNAVINSIQLVYHVGAFLLSVVTFFYLLYTNSFLFSLRQKEFGMYMMLGAKERHIQKFMRLETLVIGFISLIIGLLVGIGLAALVGNILINQLDLTSEGYKPLFAPSLLVTIFFFAGLFILTALINQVKISRLQILKLIYADAESERVPAKSKGRLWMGILGFIALSIGYFCLILMEYLREIGLLLASSMTTLGTYLLFMSVLPRIVAWLQNKQRSSGKGIEVFTFAQLSFRIRGLTKILATVAMLIALSAGAISGGMAFQNNAKQTAEVYQVYDVVIMNKSTKEESILDSITFTEDHEYRFKTDERFVYFLKDDLENNLPLIRAGYSKRDWSQAKRVTEPLVVRNIPINQLIKEESYQELSEEWMQFMQTLQPTHRMFERTFIVDLATYNMLQGSEEHIFIGKTADFTSYLNEWKQLEEVQHVRYPDAKNIAMTSKYQYFESQYAFASGTVFMGLFLGIAFLAMMASCLMFKVLSGASKDIRRYDMLRKIGVRQALLEKSIQKELFLIFLFPALLGLAHVLVGMNLFSFILLDPYYRIWVPIVLFLIIYALYYVVTVRMYKGIVLKEIELTQ